MCWGTRDSPPAPATAPLPAPRGIPGKAPPDGFLLPMAGESQQRDARDPLCSVAWACAAVALNFPPRGSHPARKRGKMRWWGAGDEGLGCTQTDQSGSGCQRGQNWFVLGLGGSVLPNVSCLPLTYIYLYTENSRCACVCIYGVCVYIYLYAVYIKIYTYIDLF